MLLLIKAHPATRTMIGGDPTPGQASSGKYPKLRMAWHGLTVNIEHPEGTVREGVDETGKPWRTVFRHAYGEIVGTMGMDGDPVDVFVGHELDAPEVYVVQQMRRKDWDTPDEQKCMINFPSIDDARAAYLQHYDDPRFFGGITAMPVEEFVTKVRATRDKPAMIKSVLFFKAHVGAYLRQGKLVNVNGYQGRAARAVATPGQMSLFGGASSGKPLGPSPLNGKDAVAHTPDIFTGEKAATAAPEANPRKKYYVTMLRDGKPKPAYLAGPFNEHQHALDHVERARQKAHEVDPFSHFDAFGTAGLEADRHPPGVLNRHLGIN